MISVIWTLLGCPGKCQHLERCRHVLACVNTIRCRHRCQHIYVPTRADIWMLFGSWDVLTCVSTSKVPTPEKVLTHADTFRYRHVPTPLGADTCRHLWYQSYQLYLDTGMCWQMPAPGNVPTPRKVPTRAGMCQHIKVPAQVSTHLRADTCWHMNVIWKLGCADMYQHLEGADTWEGADTCRHL